MESAAREGDWRRAAQLAAELSDQESVIRFSLRAGEAAQAAKDPLGAAQSFRQAGAWMPAIRCYEEAGRLREALETVEEGLESLETGRGGRPAGACRAEDLSLMRADLLLRLGRSDTAASLVRSLPPSSSVAELLERGGLYAEAVQCLLDLGQTDKAAAVALRAPDRDRLQAQIFLRTDRAAEAAHLLAQLGLAREAAQAYEQAEDWGRAAYRWEASGEPQRAAEAYAKGGRLRDAARCYLLAGMPQRAEEVAGRGRRSGPSKAFIARGDQSLQAARKTLAAGDKSAAASLLLQMRPDEPGFGESAVLLAPLLIEEGFYQDALDRLRLAPREQSMDLELDLTYWEGRALEAMGKRQEAIACFERVTACDMCHRDAWERLETLRSALARPAQPTPSGGQPAVGGKLAGRYEILAELGRGGMGRVYKARDLELGEVVAIKTVLAAENHLVEEERLLREVQICRRITHPNVVRVYDLGRFEGGLFVTMEYIEGRSLEQIVRLDSPLPLERIRQWLSAIASGLHAAHAQGIVHRDLKPANIVVTASQLKILDFGIASMAGLGARLTQNGFVMGTPMYMSPDQLLGREPDSRSDLYSLGIIAYAMIAGREPYDQSDMKALMMQQLKVMPPSVRRFRRDIPEPWLPLLDRLLAKEAQDRFQSAQELLDELAQLPV